MAAESSEAEGVARLNQLRRRIERWRWTRAKRSPMPPELWTAATDVARELGAYRVARELGVGYASLRDRLSASSETNRQKEDAFVELDGSSLFAVAPATVRGEVELSDASGTKMVIRLAADQTVDVAALLAVFRRASA
jgi:hypothetical protein